MKVTVNGINTLASLLDGHVVVPHPATAALDPANASCEPWAGKTVEVTGVSDCCPSCRATVIRAWVVDDDGIAGYRVFIPVEHVERWEVVR